ncbi:KH domain/HD domain family protein [Desulforapulum autotrophicum HRM2]|uniref:Ribonuclease Y n=1 Tax=Desulforapulum autotrophicum (strain ATCC 43914 / DSM 3382 / VKM B-1955 / HRM2) TaxID=177437 RepID=C0Q974_DESAH|nr:ribonuclease Y [Desulforapulum autotrophicum]ACN16579.1 KH domain/HD domain family protein [Desulforapulum autotrophicum HRM2]
MEFIVVLSSAAGLASGFGAAYYLTLKRARIKAAAVLKEQALIIENAERKAMTLLKEAQIEAKSRLLEMKSAFDVETEGIRAELKQEEKRLLSRSEIIDHRHEKFERREMELQAKENELSARVEAHAQKEATYASLVEETTRELERVASLTADEAKTILLKSMENEANHEGAKLVKRIMSEATENADKEAKKIISTAIQRYAGDFVAERTVSVVQLPGDEMKGRIIGREGRNIRALEAATGIDLIIDDTPEAVILSGFNPVRREIARIALTRLIADGRIHPARIEDVVARVTEEVDVTIKEAGEQAAFDLGVHGVAPELIKVIGQLKFRTSYAQNVLQHSVEVAFLAGVMAAELGLNIKLAKRMGLLHDIGKAVDHEVDGPHALIGAKLARKYGETDAVVNAIAAHHEDKRPESVYDYLVQAADALSGARPGARKETLENYVKRLEELERVANSFDGVSNTYAIQAGREVRVIVESDKISDANAGMLSRDIAAKIEETLTFPGQIKVVVIRETRSVEYTNK